VSNVARIRASYEAFERGDRDGALAHAAPDIVWEQAQGLPHGGVYHGVEEVRRAIFDPLEAQWWSEFHAAPAEFLDGGDDVVVLGRYTGRAKGTGKELDVPYVHVWTFRDGRAVRFRQFVDTRGWVEALS
jgi:ketosteroid isomerase-like protein